LNLEEIYLPSSLESIGGCAFQNCEKLTIYYDGTMDDWNYNIYISGSWAYGADNITIVCTDGMLDKDGNEVEEVE
jgi:hypothetical protein